MVYTCTNTDRQTMTGGTWIEIIVLFPPFFMEEGTELVDQQLTHPRQYPLAVGDWVMVQCRLQRFDDRTGKRTRFFTIATERIRRLDFYELGVESSDTETLPDEGERGTTLLHATDDEAVDVGRNAAGMLGKRKRSLSFSEGLDTPFHAGAIDVEASRRRENRRAKQGPGKLTNG
ncbi:hypothetical protein B0H14DRAFT_3449644 [Mycena olivaceomarginata]|nr:hypothetical protein B0H14DRAFT_3449644 [Mycena olivaceomarginata]